MWKENITSLIEKIGTNFGRYMNHLQCAGDVTLISPADPVIFIIIFLFLKHFYVKNISFKQYFAIYYEMKYLYYINYKYLNK